MITPTCGNRSKLLAPDGSDLFCRNPRGHSGVHSADHDQLITTRYGFLNLRRRHKLVTDRFVWFDDMGIEAP